LTEREIAYHHRLEIWAERWAIMTKWVLYGVYRLGSEAAALRHANITRYMPSAGFVRYPLAHKFAVEADSEEEALKAGHSEWSERILPKLGKTKLLRAIEDAEQGDYDPARWRVTTASR
jgi:hypothetical protein